MYEYVCVCVCIRIIVQRLYVFRERANKRIKQKAQPQIRNSRRAKESKRKWCANVFVNTHHTDIDRNIHIRSGLVAKQYGVQTHFFKYYFHAYTDTHTYIQTHTCISIRYVLKMFCCCIISFSFFLFLFWCSLCCGSAPLKPRCIYIYILSIYELIHAIILLAINNKCTSLFGCGCVSMHYFTSHLLLVCFENERTNERTNKRTSKRATHAHSQAHTERTFCVYDFFLQICSFFGTVPHPFQLSYTFDFFFCFLFSKQTDWLCVFVCACAYYNS